MADAVAEALKTTLEGGTALAGAMGGTYVYYGLAPDGDAVPYVIFNLQSGAEENATPTDSERRTYLVKAVADTVGSAQVLAGHVDDLLHKQTLTCAGYANFYTARQTLVEYIEVLPDMRRYGHAGGMYLVRVEES